MNIKQEQIEFILKKCFEYKAKEFSFQLASDLIDNAGYQVIQQAEVICGYVDVKKVTEKVKKECFEKYYKYENVSNRVIKDYLIKSLTEFEHFGWGYKECPGFVRGMWGLTFDGKNTSFFTFKKDTGKETWNWFPYNLIETILYINGYDNAHKDVKKYGFNPEYGSSVTDYIEHNIEYFKPYALATAEYLQTI